MYVPLKLSSKCKGCKCLMFLPLEQQISGNRGSAQLLPLSRPLLEQRTSKTGPRRFFRVHFALGLLESGMCGNPDLASTKTEQYFWQGFSVAIALIGFTYT